MYEVSIVCMSIPDALQGKRPQPRHRKHTVSVGLGSNHDLKVNQDIILPTDSGWYHSVWVVRNGPQTKNCNGDSWLSLEATVHRGLMDHKKRWNMENTWWRRPFNINCNPPPPPHHHHHPTPLHHLHMSRSWSSHAAPLPAAIHAGPHCADSSLWGAKGPGKTIAPTVEKEEHDGKWWVYIPFLRIPY